MPFFIFHFSRIYYLLVNHFVKTGIYLTFKRGFFVNDFFKLIFIIFIFTNVWNLRILRNWRKTIFFLYNTDYWIHFFSFLAAKRPHLKLTWTKQLSNNLPLAYDPSTTTIFNFLSQILFDIMPSPISSSFPLRIST
jgi:hypothetical protein